MFSSLWQRHLREQLVYGTAFLICLSPLHFNFWISQWKGNNSLVQSSIVKSNSVRVHSRYGRLENVGRRSRWLLMDVEGTCYAERSDPIPRAARPSATPPFPRPSYAPWERHRKTNIKEVIAHVTPRQTLNGSTLHRTKINYLQTNIHYKSQCDATV